MGNYRDYTVGGPESASAIKKGLANGQWFLPQIERKTLRRLMQRDDYHATRDCLILAFILLASGGAAYHFWKQGNYGLFSLCFWIYCTFYTSSADSRWHEVNDLNMRLTATIVTSVMRLIIRFNDSGQAGHGTAFKTKWLNDVVYNVASFMVFREPLVWRFSHARHHTDTDIVGRDPEIDGRPLDMWNLFLAFFNVQGIHGESKKLWMHATGSVSDAEASSKPHLILTQNLLFQSYSSRISSLLRIIRPFSTKPGKAAYLLCRRIPVLFLVTFSFSIQDVPEHIFPHDRRVSSLLQPITNDVRLLAIHSRSVALNLDSNPNPNPLT